MVGRHEQVDGGDATFIELPFPSVAEDLAVAEALDRLDEFGPTKQVWWDTEVSVTRRPQREVESESVDVQHDAHATNQPVVVLRSGGRHCLTDVRNRHEPAIHRR